jgi:hypothetical protein
MKTNLLFLKFYLKKKHKKIKDEIYKLLKVKKKKHFYLEFLYSKYIF